MFKKRHYNKERSKKLKNAISRDNMNDNLDRLEAWMDRLKNIEKDVTEFTSNGDAEGLANYMTKLEKDFTELGDLCIEIVSDYKYIAEGGYVKD